MFTGNWNELGDWMAQGLQVQEVREGENGEVELVAVVPETLIPKLKKNKKSSLAETLRGMLSKAQETPGEPVRRVLGHGMGVDLIIGLDGMTRVQIWRERVYPSDIEWKTTLKNWPYAVEAVKPEKFNHMGKFYLRAGWTTRRRLPSRVASVR